MKELVEGHKYELQNFEPTEVNNIDVYSNQELQFIHKEPVDGLPTQLRTVANGTTNEEVLTMLIHRMNYLQKKFPCRENAIAITNLEQALMWLEKRTNDRKKRGVEGKQLA